MSTKLRNLPQILNRDSGANLISGISILSYNILLPNSLDGWWCYKMYSPRHNIPIQSTLWQSRVTLLENQVKVANCDVVCLQETAASSFESDFKFMISLGYDQCELYKKGRFRPATFWKSNRVQLTGQPLHRDRCLITCFKRIPEMITTSTSAAANTTFDSYIYISNCHLQAGNNAVRRLRQTHDCLEAISKDQKKQFPFMFGNNKGNKTIINKKNSNVVGSSNTVSVLSNSPQFSYLFTGDMNVDGDIERTSHHHSTNHPPLSSSAIEVLLTRSSLPARYIEDGVEISEKEKSQRIGNFIDVYVFAYSQQQQQKQQRQDEDEQPNSLDVDAKVLLKPPPTMVVENLYGVLTSTTNIEPKGDEKSVVSIKDDVGIWESHRLSSIGLELMNKVFDSFATATISSIRNNVISSRIDNYNDSNMNISNNKNNSNSNSDIMKDNKKDEDEVVMNYDDVSKWLIKINHQIGRGSEYRSALAAMKRMSPSYQSSSSKQIESNELGIITKHDASCSSDNVRSSSNRSSSNNNGSSSSTSSSNSSSSSSSSSNSSNNNNNCSNNSNMNNVPSKPPILLEEPNEDNEEKDELLTATTPRVIEPLPQDGYLNRQSFIDIYNEEIELGKVWGVASDLAACGYPLLPTSTETFKARYDRAYLSGACTVYAVRDTGGRETVCLPNENHPSDHLPIMMILEW